jgi:hypothetical protein
MMTAVAGGRGGAGVAKLALIGQMRPVSLSVSACSGTRIIGQGTITLSSGAESATSRS